MKVFISQPMRGLTDEEVKFIRQDIIDNLKKRFPNDEIDVIDSLIHEDPPEEVKVQGLWYLGESLQKMAEADLVLYYDEYNMYGGCQIEELASSIYGPFMRLRTNDFMSKKSKGLIFKSSYSERAHEVYDDEVDESDKGNTTKLENPFLPESVKEELIEDAKKIPKDCADLFNATIKELMGNKNE